MTSAEQEKAAGAHPYESLTPDVVLDALAGFGLYGDGRLMALNSYENRVYQAHLEDGRAVVLKFYRPGRWSDAQIAEEHRFSAELAAAEVPAIAPLALEGATLHHHGGFAFSVSPYRGGRQPELDDFEVLEWVGRSWRASIRWARRGPSSNARRSTCRASASPRATGCSSTR
jgi:Ser/Thr protein kinase RdoA (MazF antagonist)